MAETEAHSASNKLAVIHVLAALIQDPLLFSDNNYSFSINDFPEQFHKILFGAIEHLAKNGMEKIGYLDIDQFLKQYPIQYKVFSTNRGIEYIQNALTLYDPKKFDYYYQTLKKYSLINSLSANGIDTRDIYDPNIVDPVASAKMYERFDSLTVNDILAAEEVKIILAKETYGNSSDRVENRMGDDILELVEELQETPEMGLPLCTPKLTTLFRGQRKGCVYMMSAPTSTGKTRVAVGEACHLSVPEYYDTVKKKWVSTNLKEKVLIIETELELREVQTMALAYVSGVPETHILDGRFFGDEKERVLKAGELLKKAELFMVAITNYDTEDLISTIKKYYQIHGVQYVFYDYLSENMKIMAEGTRKTKVANLRTDQILLSMITALKDCAKQLGLYIWTATQISGNVQGTNELDYTFLRSAKSLGDKVDVGCILTAVREADRPAVESYCAKGFELEPNFVLSVYKIRRGSYQNIKVFLYFDRGTCRMTDTFVTDSKGQLIPVEDTNIELLLDKTSEEKIEDVFAPVLGEGATEWDGEF